MIQLEDYYKETAATIANSNKFNAGLATDRHTFPTEGVFIGEFEGATGNRLPALLSLEEMRGICFLTQPHSRGKLNRVIQSLILRVVASLPTGLCKVVAYDGIGLGANLIALSNLDPQIIHKGIITEPREFLSALREIQDHIPQVIQRILGYRYAESNLIEYNEKEPKNAYPYTFLIVNDYPRTLTREHIESLEAILKHCKRVGIYVIMTLDTTYVDDSPDVRQQKKDIMPIMDYMTVVYEKGNRYYIRNSLHDETFRKYKLHLDANYADSADDILGYIRDKTLLRSQKVYKLVDYAPKDDWWWTEDSSSGIRVPFGLTERSDVANLMITQQSGQNSAVVVGIPGSGKSVFLNTMICSAAIQYSPEELELYLIDFSGVEFSLYAKLKFPHARVIAPEPEREFGLSVLQKIEQEGVRRASLCRSHDVGSIEEFRHNFPDEKMPRILVIIDEFQKLFMGGNNALIKKAQEIILVLVKEYRKYGINLILATQKLSDIDRSILPRDLIANRIVFDHSPSDAALIGMGNPPPLSLGECIYNSKLGAPEANINVKTFYTPREDRERIMLMMNKRVADSNLSLNAPIIFVKDELPLLDLSSNDIKPEDIPSSVRIYVGDSFYIGMDDKMEPVYAEVGSNSNDNLLIIGGEDKVAEAIAINTAESLVGAHNDGQAMFCFLNFMSSDNPRITIPEERYGDRDLQSIFIYASSDNLADNLKLLNNELEMRKKDVSRLRRHVYITIYAAQRAIQLRRGGQFNKMSESGQLLATILKDGPQLGFHVILQIDTLNNLIQIFGDDVLQYFTHRVALQMEILSSKKVIGDELASQLYERGHECSKYRGYYFNNRNLVLTKFKPYKI